jgi:serine/threonine protein phosphatase 1
MAETTAQRTDSPEVLELTQPKVPDGTLVYAVGDVHGRADLLADIHEKIRQDSEIAKGERKVVVYLGDYVDRGPESKEVVDLLLDEPLEGFERHHLMGNHEEFLLDFLEDVDAGPGWMFNGGVATLESYGVEAHLGHDYSMEALEQLQAKFREALPETHLEFYKNLEFTHAEGDYLFVHAGIRPGVPLDDQDRDDMLWIRDEFLGSTVNHGKVVVHGHTITWEPELRPNRIGIDTGAFHSGVLTCLVLEGAEHDFVTAED